MVRQRDDKNSPQSLWGEKSDNAGALSHLFREHSLEEVEHGLATVLVEDSTFAKEVRQALNKSIKIKLKESL